jgi:hypothetical protein
MSKKKKSTEEMIEELAIMAGRGFADTATKADIEALTKEMRGGFAAADQRLERIEFSTAGLGRRLDTVEDRVRQLAAKIGISLN